MKRIVVIMIIYLSSIGLYSQTNPFIQIETSPARVIEFHRLDGSVYEQYDNAGFWFELIPSNIPNPFMRIRHQKTIYEYTNLQGKMIETYDFKTFHNISRFKHQKNSAKYSIFDFIVFPNPTNREYFTIIFSLKEETEIKLVIADMLGVTIKVINAGKLHPGKNAIEFDKRQIQKGVYYISISDGKNTETQSVIIN